MEMIIICKHINRVQNPKTLEYVCSDCAEVLSPEYMSSISVSNQTLNENGIKKRNVSQYVEIGDSSATIDKIGSNIGFSHCKIFTDIYGNLLNGKKQRKFRKYKKYHRIIRMQRNSKHIDALIILDQVSKRLDIPIPVSQRAGYLYKKIIANTEKKDIRNCVLLVALCLRLAIQESKHYAPISLEKMVNTFANLGHGVTKRLIVRLALSLKPVYKKFLTLRKKESEDYIRGIISIVVNSDFVKKQLKFWRRDPEEYTKNLLDYSIAILKETNMRERGGKNPYMLAVATVYSADRLISELKERECYITQIELAKLTDISDYVIRSHWNEVFKIKVYQIIRKIENKKITLLDYS